MVCEHYFMGIDGGGSTVRVLIARADMQTCGTAIGGTVNPGLAGCDAAAQTVQVAMYAALENARLDPGMITAVGIGVAGAAAHHSADWLKRVVSEVLPSAQCVPSADFEIALVGALGERQGVLLLAGTGSLAYGVNSAGETALVGGWGYLIDDAGSGYWIGARALEAVARASDGRGTATDLTTVVLSALELAQPLDVIPWLYHAGPVRNPKVAALAPLVLQCATAGDLVAHDIIALAADELMLAVKTVMRRLALDAAGIAFTGGLLSTPNALNRRICDRLGLASLPQPRYSPVMGAVLLAQLAHENLL